MRLQGRRHVEVAQSQQSVVRTDGQGGRTEKPIGRTACGGRSPCGVSGTSSSVKRGVAAGVGPGAGQRQVGEESGSDCFAASVPSDPAVRPRKRQEVHLRLDSEHIEAAELSSAGIKHPAESFRFARLRSGRDSARQAGPEVTRSAWPFPARPAAVEFAVLCPLSGAVAVAPGGACGRLCGCVSRRLVIRVRRATRRSPPRRVRHAARTRRRMLRRAE